MPKILVIDDEKNIRDGIKKSLEFEGYEVVTAENGEKGIETVYKGGIDLVITDLKMPEKTGEEFLKDILEFDKHIPVIVLTGHGNVETAVEMMRLGAYDFMTKPFNLDKMLLIIARALESKNIKKTNETLEKRVDYNESFYGMIGHSAKILKVYEAIKQVARTKATVLIEGESGTGKELVASAIHQISDRAKQPYITVNCAALSEGVLESELFGHEKGSFTGAVDKKIGRFEAANKGTIFLDEIGEINQAVQVKLLRVLEERVIERVGSNTPIDVDIRVIAATNKKLSEEIKAGKFREDLYYRLNVIKIEMPPLRERREDIPLLIDNFIKEFSKVHSIEINSVDKKVYKILSSLQWDGNVRELRNTIETMVVMCRDGKIDENSIPDWALKSSSNDDFVVEENVTLEELEKMYINYLLSHNNFNKAQVAKILGIERATLYRKLKEDSKD
ncbi:sigma-54 dependent transcriptional regulator [Brachyspira sp. G79]|uniref:sigma-54-dependent transcriptional regulator n=1 Tax=Brachyspira sp. G79 TaxID=1358104 RepID=UPI000BBC7B45|nr:sigma-54 dependent transcriptional regulator [Brachyspira sp. G79]PCG19615.1 acetoacetate metabolism regulatory protein AtoC [Brachyspira sp. G79]